MPQTALPWHVYFKLYIQLIICFRGGFSKNLRLYPHNLNRTMPAKGKQITDKRPEALCFRVFYF
jgi:hypothetical protein